MLSVTSSVLTYSSRPLTTECVIPHHFRNRRCKQEDNIFVNRVSKRDAPNYYEIITRPMYLNLMAKKLKQGDYSSKADFQVTKPFWLITPSIKVIVGQMDLDLIVSNCRQYNTDPESIYRIRADQLEAHARELMAAVPSIDLSRVKTEGRRPPMKGPGRPRKQSQQKSDEDNQSGPRLTDSTAPSKVQLPRAIQVFRSKQLNKLSP